MPPVLARDPVDVMFQIAGAGPMFGQVGHFHLFDGKAITDPRPLQR
jgi:GST-like protein